MATVRLDGLLREFTPRRTVNVSGRTVGEVLDALEAELPRLRFRLRDESGAVRRFVRVFVDGEEIGTRSGLATRVGADDTIDILHSIQGG